MRSHEPGDWIENVVCRKCYDYKIPEATTLLLIGPMGAGKSTLINRITRLFDYNDKDDDDDDDDEDDFFIDRAQVSYNLSATMGTCFLQEYMIPRQGKFLCICSLSMAEDGNLLRSQMNSGVGHGEKIIRNSDDEETRERIDAMARNVEVGVRDKRRVDFVILVVNGASVLKSIDADDKQYGDMLFEMFDNPYSSFKDNKLIVVVTHGDNLTLFGRARVREHLGELMGIPPLKFLISQGQTEERQIWP